MRAWTCGMFGVACLALSGVAQAQPTDYFGYDGELHQDDTLGFALVIPADWEKPSDTWGTAVVALSPADSDYDTFRENINVTTEDLPSGITPDDYFNASKDNMKTLNNYTPLAEGEWDFPSYQGIWIEYTAELMEGGNHNFAYIVVTPAKGYVLTCSAVPDTFETWRPMFEQIASSFQVQVQ